MNFMNSIRIHFNWVCCVRPVCKHVHCSHIWLNARFVVTLFFVFFICICISRSFAFWAKEKSPQLSSTLLLSHIRIFINFILRFYDLGRRKTHSPPSNKVAKKEEKEENNNNTNKNRIKFAVSVLIACYTLRFIFSSTLPVLGLFFCVRTENGLKSMLYDKITLSNFSVNIISIIHTWRKKREDGRVHECRWGGTHSIRIAQGISFIFTLNYFRKWLAFSAHNNPKPRTKY